MRDTPKVAGLIQPRARPHLCPETCSLAVRSWPYCVLSGQPVRSALRDRRSVTEKRAERGFVERRSSGAGLVCPKVLSPRTSPLWPLRLSGAGGQTLCSARGGGAPPAGSHSPPPFRPRFSAPHPFHVFFLMAFGCFVSERFFVSVGVLDFSFSFFFLFRFVSSFVFPGFVLDVDAVFCP